MNVLIVDGYNIIGAWRGFHEVNDLALARDHLLNLMADYQAFSGFRVIVVFDAHHADGPESKMEQYKVEIIYTKKDETADECIERLILKYKNIQNEVYVATSDYLEQRIIFGKGALRKSARELLLEIEEFSKEVESKMEEHKKEKPPSTINLNDDIRAVFEKWRRGVK